MSAGGHRSAQNQEQAQGSNGDNVTDPGIATLPPLPVAPITSVSALPDSAQSQSISVSLPPSTTSTRPRPGPAIVSVQRPKNVGTWAGRTLNSDMTTSLSTSYNSTSRQLSLHRNATKPPPILWHKASQRDLSSDMAGSDEDSVLASSKNVNDDSEEKSNETPRSRSRTSPGVNIDSRVVTPNTATTSTTLLTTTTTATFTSATVSPRAKLSRVPTDALFSRSPREIVRTLTQSSMTSTTATATTSTNNALPRKLGRVSEGDETSAKRSNLFGNDIADSEAMLSFSENPEKEMLSENSNSPLPLISIPPLPHTIKVKKPKKYDEIEEAEESEGRGDEIGDVYISEARARNFHERKNASRQIQHDNAKSDDEDDEGPRISKNDENDEDDDDDSNNSDDSGSDVGSNQNMFVASIMPTKAVNPLPPSLVHRVQLTLEIPPTISAKFCLPSSAAFSASVLVEQKLSTLKHSVLTRNVDILEIFTDEQSEDNRKVVDESEWVFQAGDIEEDHILFCEDLKLNETAYFLHCIRNHITPLLTLIHRSDLEIRHYQIEYILGKQLTPSFLTPSLIQFREQMAYSLNRVFSVNFLGIPHSNEVAVWLLDKRTKFEIQVIRPASIPTSLKTIVPIPVECDVMCSAFDVLKILAERYPFLFSETKVDPFDFAFKVQGVEQYIITSMKLLAFEQIQALLRFNRPIVLLLYPRAALPTDVQQKLLQWETMQNFTNYLHFDLIDKPADKHNNILTKGYRSSWDVAISFQVVRVTLPRAFLEYSRARKIIKELPAAFLVFTMGVYNMGQLIGVPGFTMTVPINSETYTTSSAYVFMCTTQISAPFNRIPLSSVLHFQVFAVVSIAEPKKERLGWGSARIFDEESVALNGTIKVRCCDGNEVVYELLDDVEPETLGKEFEIEVEIPPTCAKVAFPDRYVQEEYFKKNKIELFGYSTTSSPNTMNMANALDHSYSGSGGSDLMSGGLTNSPTTPTKNKKPEKKGISTATTPISTPSAVTTMMATIGTIAPQASVPDESKGLGILAGKKNKKKQPTSTIENLDEKKYRASVPPVGNATATNQGKFRDPQELANFLDKFKKNPLKDIQPDQRVVISNNLGFCVQNHWALAKFILFVSWNQPRVIQELYYLIRYDDEIELEPVSCLEILQSACRDKYLRRFACKKIDRISDDDFNDLVLHLVTCLQHERDDDSALSRLLIIRGILNPHKIGSSLFWNLLEMTQTSTYKRRYERILYTFLYYTPYRHRYLYQLEIHEKFREILFEIPRIPEGERTAFVQHQLKEFEFSDYYFLPTNPNLVLLSGFAYNKCKYNEASKTLEIVLHNADPFGSDVLLNFKRYDQVKYQQLMFVLLTIMDKLWLESNLDLKLLYPQQIYLSQPHPQQQQIVRCALYELHPHAQKVDAIYRSRDTTNRGKKFLLSWLIDNNSKNGAFIEVQRHFIRSCAGYSVASVVLSLGNRSSNTIMCSKYGQLIHTDLQKSNTSNANLSDSFRPEFSSVIGNSHEAHFKWFTVLCVQAYNLVRTNSPVFLRLMKMMADIKFADTDAQDVLRLIKILQLDKLHQEAGVFFTDLIDSCMEMQNPGSKPDGSVILVPASFKKFAI